MSRLKDEGNYPPVEEIAAELNIDVDKIQDIIMDFQDPMSLSTQIGDDIYLEDTLAQQEDFSMEEEIFNEMGRKQVRDMVNQLEEREKEILKLRYGLDGYEIHTLEEIGNTLNITRERVRQIEKKTLQKLRSKYTKELKGDLF